MKTIQAEKPFEIQVLELEEWEKRPIKNNFFELVYIVKGKGEQCINYNNNKYEGGNIFLLPPLRCHSFNIKKPTKFVFLKFTKSFFLKTGNSSSSDYIDWFKEAAYVLINYKRAPGELIENKSDRLNVINLINIILHESKNQGAIELIKSLMVSILHVLVRSIKESMQGVVSETGKNIRQKKIMDYIQENLGEPTKLRIESLSKEFCLSPNYISEFFRKETDISLREYIAKSRLKLVEMRLLYSDYTLNQIADEFGFTDASHLSRMFRKYSGKTVREFKKKGDYHLLKKVI